MASPSPVTRRVRNSIRGLNIASSSPNHFFFLSWLSFLDPMSQRCHVGLLRWCYASQVSHLMCQLRCNKRGHQVNQRGGGPGNNFFSDPSLARPPTSVRHPQQTHVTVSVNKSSRPLMTVTRVFSESANHRSDSQKNPPLDIFVANFFQILFSTFRKHKMTHKRRKKEKNQSWLHHLFKACRLSDLGVSLLGLFIESPSLFPSPRGAIQRANTTLNFFRKSSPY
jgi:hypothetical protein